MQSDPALLQRGLGVVDVLGVGGNSIVYRAHDPRHGRDVAVKVLRADGVSETANARFEREVRVAGGLRHPHIRPLFVSGALADGRRFAVMPIAQGRPLRAMIDEGPLTVTDAVRLTREVAEALAHLHALHWVHRDVKPENILVEAGHAVLTDFGIATPMRSRDEWESTGAAVSLDGIASRVTEVGKVVGTPAYMSPEAFTDGAIDGRSDLFALGLVLYEMLAGVLPHNRLSAALLTDPYVAPPSIRQHRPDVPAELDALIRRVTDPEPEKRFASASEVVTALERIRLPGREGGRLRLGGRDVAGWLVVSGLAIALLAGVAGLMARHAMLPDPSRVVVADFTNETGLPALDPFGEMAGDVVVAAFSRAPGLSVINAVVALGARQRSPAPVADSIMARTRDLVRQTRAGVVVTGSFFAEGSRISMMAEITDTRSSRILGVVGPMPVDTARAEQGLGALADSVVRVVRQRYAPPPG